MKEEEAKEEEEEKEEEKEEEEKEKEEEKEEKEDWRTISPFWTLSLCLFNIGRSNERPHILNHTFSCLTFG